MMGDPQSNLTFTVGNIQKNDCQYHLSGTPVPNTRMRTASNFSELDKVVAKAFHHNGLGNVTVAREYNVRQGLCEVCQCADLLVVGHSPIFA